MDAVGDVADGHLLHRLARPEALPHLPADLAVQFAHAVGRAGMFQAQHGHAESFVLVLRVHLAQRHHFVQRNLQLAHDLHQRVGNQVPPEAVVARLHRGVGGEDALLPGFGGRLREVRPAAIFSRINSSVRKAACPSFM